MQNLEQVYKRLEENKRKKRDLAKMLKDELEHVPRYQEIKDAAETLREEKKGIEQEVRAGVAELHEIEDLKIDIATDQEMLADIALNMYTNNQTVEIIDEYDQTWHPVFKVTFKKSN